MTKHKHDHCKHENLKYCEHCKVVHCLDCKQEFPEKQVVTVEKVVYKERDYHRPFWENTDPRITYVTNNIQSIPTDSLEVSQCCAHS